MLSQGLMFSFSSCFKSPKFQSSLAYNLLTYPARGAALRTTRARAGHLRALLRRPGQQPLQQLVGTERQRPLPVPDLQAAHRLGEDGRPEPAQQRQSVHDNNATKELPNLASAKDIAEAHGLDVGKVRSALSREYWGPKGQKGGRAQNSYLRTDVNEPGARDTKYLWNTKLVQPVINRLR